MEHLIVQLQNHESDPNLGNFSTHQNNSTNDLDVPIALRKKVKSCTQHPISNFIGYSHLSNSVQALIANLPLIEIPKSIYEALSIPEWRKQLRKR